MATPQKGSKGFDRKHVRVLSPLGTAWGRELFRGVVDYARSYTNWDVHLDDFVHGSYYPSYEGPVDGLIAAFINKHQVDKALKHKFPVIAATGVVPVAFPSVHLDNVAIGRMAARYLANLGREQFGYVGLGANRASLQRLKGFCQALRRQGLKDIWVDTGTARAPEAAELGLEGIRSVRSIKGRTSVFAFNDVQASLFARRCVAAGIRIPDDVAILGVDNDDLLCETTEPHLSSIAVNSRHVGSQAAELLRRKFENRSVPKKPVLIPPVRVITRQSSDIISCEDEVVSIALRFIRARAGEPISVSDVLKHIPLCRRAFERRFLSVIGRTPHQEITRVRVERIRDMLVSTDLPIERISPECGFRYPARMITAFRKATGMTPKAFRRQAR